MASLSDDMFILRQCTWIRVYRFHSGRCLLYCHHLAIISQVRLGLLVGYYVTPVACAGRVVHLTSHLCAIVLMAGYAGNYISFLSSGRPLVMPFTSLSGMLEDGSYRAGVMSRSAQINFYDVRGFVVTLISHVSTWHRLIAIVWSRIFLWECRILAEFGTATNLHLYSWVIIV
jgi:hypothetical protein